MEEKENLIVLGEKLQVLPMVVQDPHLYHMTDPLDALFPQRFTEIHQGCVWEPCQDLAYYYENNVILLPHFSDSYTPRIKTAFSP